MTLRTLSLLMFLSWLTCSCAVSAYPAQVTVPVTPAPGAPAPAQAAPQPSADLSQKAKTASDAAKAVETAVANLKDSVAAAG